MKIVALIPYHTVPYLMEYDMISYEDHNTAHRLKLRTPIIQYHIIRYTHGYVHRYTQYGTVR